MEEVPGKPTLRSGDTQRIRKNNPKGVKRFVNDIDKEKQRKKANQATKGGNHVSSSEVVRVVSRLASESLETCKVQGEKGQINPNKKSSVEYSQE